MAQPLARLRTARRRTAGTQADADAERLSSSARIGFQWNAFLTAPQLMGWLMRAVCVSEHSELSELSELSSGGANGLAVGSGRMGKPHKWRKAPIDFAAADR